jgi:hypothetical protein
LATKVKATHLGEVKLRGPSGETVEVVAYVDKMQIRRRVCRLRQKPDGPIPKPYDPDSALTPPPRPRGRQRFDPDEDL